MCDHYGKAYKGGAESSNSIPPYTTRKQAARCTLALSCSNFASFRSTEWLPGCCAPLLRLSQIQFTDKLGKFHSIRTLTTRLSASREGGDGIPDPQRARALVVHHVLPKVHVGLVPDLDPQLLARPVIDAVMLVRRAGNVDQLMRLTGYTMDMKKAADWRTHLNVLSAAVTTMSTSLVA